MPNAKARTPWDLALDEGKTVAVAARDPGLTESLAPITQLTRTDNRPPFGEKKVRADFVAINGIPLSLHGQRLSAQFRVIEPHHNGSQALWSGQ